MRLIPAAAALLLVASASAAFAEDGKVFPASLCQPKNSTHVPRADYTGNGRVCNVSNSSALILRCPIVRDTMNGGITFFKVFAKVAHPDGIVCVLRSLRPDTVDGWGWYQEMHLGLTANNDPNAWTFVQGAGLMAQVYNGPYELTCTLPAVRLWGNVPKQSCLGAYSITEE